VLFLFWFYFRDVIQCQSLRPQLLYLLSPSARKNTHGVHDDHHDFPALKQHQTSKTEPAVEIIKDDEGTEANVASSIALSEVRIVFLIPGV